MPSYDTADPLSLSLAFGTTLPQVSSCCAPPWWKKVHVAFPGPSVVRTCWTGLVQSLGLSRKELRFPAEVTARNLAGTRVVLSRIVKLRRLVGWK